MLEKHREAGDMYEYRAFSYYTIDPLSTDSARETGDL